MVAMVAMETTCAGKSLKNTAAPARRGLDTGVTKCVYPSISPFFVTVEADLIQSIISVSVAGYAPETHQIAFPL